MSINSVGYADQSFQGLSNIKTVETHAFTLVNTTSSTAITSIGTNTVTVAAVTNIVVGEVLQYDSGANAEYVTVTSVSGSTFTAVFTKTHAASVAVTNVVQRQSVMIGDPTTQVNFVGVGPKGTQQPFALQTQAMLDSGRTTLTLVADTQLGSGTSEGLITFVQNLGNTQTTGVTNYTVSSGKTLRIQAINVMAYNISGTLTPTQVNTTVRLRSAASGSVTTSSSLRIAIQSGLVGAQSASNPPFSLSGEVEFPSGTVIGFTRQDSSSGFNEMTVSIVGYEF